LVKNGHTNKREGWENMPPWMVVLGMGGRRKKGARVLYYSDDIAGSTHKLTVISCYYCLVKA